MRKRIIWVGLMLGCLLGMLPLSASAVTYQSADQAALLAIAKANFSSNTSANWTTEKDPGKWQGVVWNSAKEARVTQIFLHDTALAGKFSPTALTELVVLDVGENGLTSVDLTKNTKLTALDVSGNALTTLNVTKNTELQSLLCGDNQLTSLDLSAHTKLVQLTCDGNSLGALDVSRNTKLQLLWCYDNRLNALNLTKLPDLKDLDCEGNFLTSLDLSKNGKLVDLACSDNELKHLDLSTNVLLERLWCSGNHLTELDLSKNTKLKTVDVNANDFASREAITGLGSGVELNYGKQQIKNTGLITIFGRETTYPATLWNWFLAIVCFGWIWMPTRA